MYINSQVSLTPKAPKAGSGGVEWLYQCSMYTRCSAKAVAKVIKMTWFESRPILSSSNEDSARSMSDSLQERYSNIYYVLWVQPMIYLSIFLHCAVMRMRPFIHHNRTFSDLSLPGWYAVAVLLYGTNRPYSRENFTHVPQGTTIGTLNLVLSCQTGKCCSIHLTCIVLGPAMAARCDGACQS